jgi:DNA-binding CsgD family transcriptional regulator
MSAQVLTRRELEIAQLACEGLSNKEIAIELGLSEGTVKQHLHSSFAKLGIKRRVFLRDHCADGNSPVSIASSEGANGDGDRRQPSRQRRYV